MKLCLVFSSFFFARLQISLGRIPITGLCATLFVLLMQPMVFAANITIDTVPVGNAGNAADDTGFGAVAYNYRIGTTEVTNAQYAHFLNSVDPMGENSLETYHGFMTFSDRGGIDFDLGAVPGSKYQTKAGFEDRPVNFVDWFDAIRFTNWLHNGQGAGDTEIGAYDLVTPHNYFRRPDAKWFLPSEDEWYKAAYHKNDGVTGNYFDYPTSSDDPPTSEAPPGGPNSANYDFYEPIFGYPTDAGSFVDSVSPYATFDQGGNVWEWTETLAPAVDGIVLRGGSFIDNISFLSAEGSMESYSPGPHVDYPEVLGSILGFRVATVPEPSSLALAGMAIVCGIVFCRRRR